MKLWSCVDNVHETVKSTPRDVQTERERNKNSVEASRTRFGDAREKPWGAQESPKVPPYNKSAQETIVCSKAWILRASILPRPSQIFNNSPQTFPKSTRNLSKMLLRAYLGPTVHKRSVLRATKRSPKRPRAPKKEPRASQTLPKWSPRLPQTQCVTDFLGCIFLIQICIEVSSNFWWILKARFRENSEKPWVFRWFLLIFTKSPYLQNAPKIIPKSSQNPSQIFLNCSNIGLKSQTRSKCVPKPISNRFSWFFQIFWEAQASQNRAKIVKIWEKILKNRF